jgi:hypothetical protein
MIGTDIDDARHYGPRFLDLAARFAALTREVQDEIIARHGTGV